MDSIDVTSILSETPASLAQAAEPQAALGVTPGPGRKKGTACARCRTQKIRCDDKQPSCGNCSRVGCTCVRPNQANNSDSIGVHLYQVEARLRWLENALRQVAPEKLERAPSISAPLQSMAIDPPRDPAYLQSRRGSGLSQHRGPGSETSPDTSASTHIEPNEPLAHEVGLLSLANSKESKYLGPSSGVPFARLIFSAIPQSQGLSTSQASKSQPGSTAERAQPFPSHWVFEADLQHFVDAYFEEFAPLYPFLDEDLTQEWLQELFDSRNQSDSRFPQLSEIEAFLSPIQCVQFFLIAALGSRTLEARLSTDFMSERYFATAMLRVGLLALHDSIEGLQTMLLLTLCSLNLIDGPNAWFLVSNIIASCLDLGFQRRWGDISHSITQTQRRQLERKKMLRSGIFWSAYSLERQLCVVLGRPLTLRDEAIDVEFPQGFESMTSRTETGNAADSPEKSTSKRAKVEAPSFLVSHSSFRFDQILAEIKLTLHRVVNKPERFPWPTDVGTFQTSTHQLCDELYQDIVGKGRRQSRRSASDHGMRSLEIKYHHCLMLLHRPSPANSHPTLASWRICYNSAVRTILVFSEMQRFAKLNSSWLTAHNIFVCGITFLYCLWINPGLLQEVGLDTFKMNAEACCTLLQHLGKTWSVAAEAKGKFERLVETTSALWKARTMERSTEVEVSQSLLSMQQAQWQDLQRIDNSGIDAEQNVNVGAFDFPMSQAPFADNEIGNFHVDLGDMSTWFDLDWII